MDWYRIKARQATAWAERLRRSHEAAPVALLLALLFFGAALAQRALSSSFMPQPAMYAPLPRWSEAEPIGVDALEAPAMPGASIVAGLEAVPPYRFTSGTAAEPRPLLLALAATPAEESEARDPNNPAVIGGIDYSDPIGRGTVPLERVAGRLGERLSRGFRVGDFASRDGAPYARISDALVSALERVRQRAGSLAVISGYRHPEYNARVEVGGVRGSQHVAGRAADVWSGTKTPLELAQITLETVGCGVGLGLGPNTLHVDLRGWLASWTYPGAALDEAAFDALVRKTCGLQPADDALAEEAAADSLGAPADTLLEAAVDPLPVHPPAPPQADSGKVSTVPPPSLRTTPAAKVR